MIKNQTVWKDYHIYLSRTGHFSGEWLSRVYIFYDPASRFCKQIYLVRTRQDSNSIFILIIIKLNFIPNDLENEKIDFQRLFRFQEKIIFMTIDCKYIICILASLKFNRFKNDTLNISAKIILFRIKNTL